MSEVLAEEPRRTKGVGCGLLVGLFDGIGGLRSSAEIVGLPIVGAVSVESDKGCRRLVEQIWPDSVRYEDVKSFWCSRGGRAQAQVPPHIADSTWSWLPVPGVQRLEHNAAGH